MKKLLTATVALLALVGLLLLSLPTILHKAGLHPEYNGPTAELPGKPALVNPPRHGFLGAPGGNRGPGHRGVWLRDDPPLLHLPRRWHGG